jgi:hypothetical protein
MSSNVSLRVGVTAAALAMLSASPMTSAATSDNSTKLHRHHAHHALYRAHAAYRGPMAAEDRMLPEAPEYGFLRHVPPNAIQMPGYTFVPGHGILGASCDLPTSACSNEYRDVQ